MEAVVVISPRSITNPVLTAASTRNASLRVLAHDSVNDGVADLIAHLVGVPLRHRLAGKEKGGSGS